MEKVVLLEDSFISPLLIETIKSMKLKTYSPSEKVKQKHPDLNYLSFEELKKALQSEEVLIYSNSEEALKLVFENSNNEKLIRDLKTLKNKFETRQLMKKIFPNYFYVELNANELKDFKPIEKDLIIKPSIGFFSKGVRKITRDTDMKKLAEEAIKEVEASNSFSSSILNSEKFIIEEFIKGEEYACDFYFNKKKEPVITSISKHLFADEKDFRDVLYYTSKKIVKEVKPVVEDFLKNFQKEAELSVFPIHLEFKIFENKLYPIEFNPLRFGGYSLADITYHAYGVNPYEVYFNQKEIDLEKEAEKLGEKKVGFILGRREKQGKPDHEKFKSTFEKVLKYIEVNKEKEPVFSIVFAESEDLNELKKYLYEDFSKYIE